MDFSAGMMAEVSLIRIKKTLTEHTKIMIKKCGTFLLIFLILNLVQGRFIIAQEVGNETTTRKIKEKVSEIGKGRKIVVRRNDETKLKGVLSEIDADSFTVTDKKTSAETRFNYSEVKKVSRAGMSTGAKIGIAAGVAVPLIIVLALFGKRLCNEQAC